MLEPRVSLKRLEKEILCFEEKPIETGKVLFYGSSGFTRWKERWGHRPLEEDLPGCINHGFGSSTAEELLYYYPRAVKPWAPKALVVSIFHNDRGFGYSPQEVVTNLAKLLEWARTDFPSIKLYLCDCRPTLKFNGRQIETNMKEFHELLAIYCRRHEDTTLISHKDCLAFWVKPEDAGSFDPETLRKDIFVEDQIHFNQVGYDIYKEFMKEELKEILA